MASEEDLRFGWGRFRPRCLQVLNNAKGLTLFISIFTCIHTMTANGLLSAVLPDIEKRFLFTGKDLGVIALCNEIAQLVIIGFVSYYGSYGNQARWIGCGCFVTGLGCLLFDLPHLLIEDYTIEDATQVTGPDTGICNTHNSTADLACSPSTVHGRKWYHLMIFCLAQSLIGAGSCPVYSLGATYIDENVPPKSSPIYLGVWYTVGLVGSSIGLVIGGAFASIFVNGEPPAGIKPGDPNWIGAWWIGYLLSGGLLILCSVIILGYPRHFAGSKERQNKAIAGGELPKVDTNIKGECRKMLPVFLKLLRNVTFVLTTLSRALSNVVLGGLSAFLTKMFLTRYPMEPSKAGAYIFVPMLTSCIVGSMLGSVVCRLFEVKKCCKLSAKFLLVVVLLATCSVAYLYVPGCTHRDMTGVTQPYNASISSKIELVNSCNQNCACQTDQMNPVCSQEGTMFLTPCHAGCHTTSTLQIYGNCSCISSSTMDGGLASNNFCSTPGTCLYMWLHLVFFGLFVIFIFAAETPYKMVILRCVSYNHRGFAMGVQVGVNRVLGMLSGAILFGSLFDFSCLVWSEKCGEQGNCLWYDVDKFFNWLATICIGLGAVATLLALFAYWSIKPYPGNDHITEHDREDATTAM